MRGRVKGALLWLCAALICFSAQHARAEFSPRLEEMKERGLTLELSAQLDALAPLSESSLAVVNDWLRRLNMTLTLREAAAQSFERAGVTLDGETLLDISTVRTEEGARTVFSPFGRAYITGPGERDALSLLAGTAGSLPEIWKLPARYAALAQELYPLLAAYVPPKTVNDTTSIKNAAASASYENYVLPPETMNEAWPEIYPLLLPALKDMLGDEADGQMRELRFSAPCQVKRFFDKAGQDMGLQLTGRVLLGEEERKVTLTGGSTPDKGGSFSLALPAVKGKNTLKITFGAKLTQKDGLHTLTLEGTYQRTLEGKTESVSLDATLKNTIKNGDETWSGKVTVEQSGSKGKYTWTLTPKCAFDDDGLTGTLTVQKKKGSAAQLKGTVNVRMLSAEESVPSEAETVNLRGMGEEDARALLHPEEKTLSRAFFRLMDALPEASRILLTHELRTAEWMVAPSVPVLEEKATEENIWIVEEETP